MKIMNCFLLVTLICIFGCSGSNSDEEPVIPKPEVSLSISPDKLMLSDKESTQSIVVTSNANWTVSSNQGWCICSPASGFVGSTGLQVKATTNPAESSRSAILTFTSGDYVKTYTVQQEAAKIIHFVPAGYNLVWQDEFNEAQTEGKSALPDMNKWHYETGAGGWGNNELQTYVPGIQGTDTCALISNGTLKIIAQKKGNQVISIRMNTNQSWTYGFFEARLKLPQGKGTWPAFWMLPKNFKNWPDDGEIDIMEEVGYRPNWVLSTIHCKAYNHSIGTQKSAEKFLSTAESDFHVYALEWTEDYIWGYVDGECYFKFDNDKKGDKNTWPFNVPFYLKLNLAWGGNWGGAQGVDESKLPASYEIDYVRVYQK